MPSYAILRLLESYFRRPVAYLIPVLLLGLLGGYVVMTQESEFRSTGVVFVEDETLLSTLTEVGGADGTWRTPADYTSSQLNSLLATDAFVGTVVEQSELADPATLTGDTYRLLRESITSWDQGENLMHVSAAHEDPAVAHALAGATIESLIQFEINAEVSQSAVAEGFLDPLTERYREELANARTALQDYLEQNPEPIDGERPASEQLVVDGLMTEVTDANARYTDALTKEESARLANEQAESDVRNRLQLVDAPEMPVAPESGRKAKALTWAVFLGVGGLLSLGAVTVGAVADRSLRLPQEISKRLGTEALAVVPDASAWLKKPTRRKA